ILFALDRLVAMRRVRDALWLGVGFALQGLTSVYLLVFSTWMIIFAVPARAWEWLRTNPIQMLRCFLVAGATAAILLGPYLVGYYALHLGSGFERGVVE